jgi:hypothetical protein
MLHHTFLGKADLNEQLVVDGTATVYRLFDIGYAIDLDRAATLLGETTTERALPRRVEAQAIRIPNPPLFTSIGSWEIDVGANRFTATLSARLFNFGVCSLQLQIVAPPALPWESFSAFATDIGRASGIGGLFERELHALVSRVRAGVERVAIAPLSEEYIVFRVDRIHEPGGAGPVADRIADDQLVALLLGEERSLSATARRELLPHRFSYYDDDFAVLTWDNALVVEPRAHDRDVEYVLEFANAQLLELRIFDAQLDAELPALYDRVNAARRRVRFSRRLRTVLSDLQTRLADITETVERVENALKVTDDVYLARIYGAALELFRERPWRRGIERKLGILRDSYSMLNAEAQAARTEALEIIIVLLIVIEIVLSLVR